MASMILDMIPTPTICMKKRDPTDSGPDIAESTISGQHVAFDKISTKKLLRKLDWHLIPFLALIYLLCFLDRTNIGNARLAYLETDLEMWGLDYNLALSIFFPFYVLAEIPSNMILKKFRPSVWFTIIMVAWGIVMIGMGFVRDFKELLICRICLGIAEGGLFPGITYYLTMWYPRHECGLRIALFFSAATMAGAFGGLLAKGIAELDMVNGRPGWSWIFILEGLLTLVIGAFSIIAVQDYPATTNFLTANERVEVERRLSEDSGLNEDFNIKYFWDALKDWKIWAHMLITIGIFTPLYSIALFLPTIVKAMGYSDSVAQLMSAPPYVVACLFTIFGSYFADKAGQRGIFLLGFEVMAFIGFLMLVLTGQPHIQYTGTFLATSGIFSLVPLIGAWTANNIGGSMKRGVGIAMQVGFGNLGGAIGGFVYLSTDSPRYIQGHCILIGLITMSFVITIIMSIYYRYENARRETLAVQNISTEQLCAERMKGDRAVFFRYTV